MLKSQLQLLGEGFLARTGDDNLLAISEGFIKVRCAEVALSLGWTLQEGVGNKGIADFANLVDGNVVWRRGKRMLYAAEGSADLAIVSPFEMMLEIKARPDHGTKSQAQFEQMDFDVARVAADPACALLFVFETKAYRSFSSEKEESRGRRAIMSRWFNECFPKLASIPLADWLVVEAIRDERQIALSFRLCQHSRADQTILVLGCQAEANAESKRMFALNEFDLLDP
jgi:hypothetical protein